MNAKKSFKIYYLLVFEGTAEFNIFAYLTKNKFRELFEESRVRFSNKVEIVGAGISQARLDGVSSFRSFKIKYDLIKKKYSGQKLFFILDKDLDDSSRIEGLIREGGDIVQFLIYNSEYLLLKLASKTPKKPSDFSNMKEFRNYSKAEFEKQFDKKASDFKDSDFDLIFNNLRDEVTKKYFAELFSVLS